MCAPELVVSEKFKHVPVMADEIVAIFRDAPAGWIVDGTLGGAGHAQLILESCPHLSVLGIDQDATAVEVATQRLAKFGDRAKVVNGRFDSIAEILAANSISNVSGVLLDLGVSSHQFDTPERGFSYRSDAPLDMRMDRTNPKSALTVVNEYEVKELERVIREFSDERFAGRIARAIVSSRPVATTGQLAEIVASAIPAPARRRGGNPAKRTFQAIRIEVNAELDVLSAALKSAGTALAPGGRLVVLSYHSGEDRIVKAYMRSEESGNCTCPAGLPCGCGSKPTMKRVRVSPKPSGDEIESNPRAASARLRVSEKLAEGSR